MWHQNYQLDKINKLIVKYYDVAQYDPVDDEI